MLHDIQSDQRFRFAGGIEVQIQDIDIMGGEPLIWFELIHEVHGRSSEVMDYDDFQDRFSDEVLIEVE